MKPTLTIIRGLPGAGKTTLAQALKRSAPNSAHFEADQFFTDSNGVYAYDHARIGEAHMWCFLKVKEALENTHDTIVSNTFTSYEHMRPYLELGYPVRIIEVHGPWKSVHGVPDDALQRMRDRWEPTPGNASVDELKKRLGQEGYQRGKTGEALDTLAGLAKELVGNLDIPEPNCSCHLSPPCHDCVTYGGLRDAAEAVTRSVAASRKLLEEKL